MPESLPALSLKARVVAAARALAGRPDTNANLPRDGVGGQLLGGILRPGGEPAARAVSTFLGAYGQSPWFRAALSRVSYDVAATEWQVYVQRTRGKAVRNRAIQRASLPNRRAQLKALQDMGELEPLATHPALDLLDRANPMQTGLQARRTTQIHLDAVGEAFWLLERNALGMPVCLWPLAPHWVKSTATPASPVYRVEFGGFRTEIPATEIIPFIDTDPANPYGRGSGTGQALSDELDTDEYAARMTRAFFFNRAKPDLVVWPKGEQGLREEEVRRLEEQWNRHNQGFWRAFRPFFLKREVEIKELDTNLRNVQFIELRSFERDTCLQVFGVSPEILGIVKPGAARATITVANQIYAQRVQVPRLEMLRTVMQERLMPLFDERLILDYVSPDVQDEELRLQAATAAPWALSVDEWRGLSKHPPLEDDAGKVHMMPGTVTPTLPEEFGDVEPPAPVVAIPPAPPMPGTRPGPGAEPEAPEPPPPMPDDEDEVDEDAAAFVAWRRAAKVTLRERG